MAWSILGAGILAVWFGFVQLGNLQKESETQIQTKVYPYFDLVKNREYAKAYELYFHFDFKNQYNLERYLEAQRQNEQNLGALKNFRVLQVRNGAGFTQVKDYTLFLELNFEKAKEEVVVRIRRPEEDQSQFLIDGIWKGSYGRSALLWEKTVY
ncbi:hypothetical protein LPTSP4_18780 [Leptospira ryugenii]|uniref:Uncharacterized protein n=1 Tax=Leptospira ryugenii TaxID=1917863 RepID=A0A2P2E0E6_9LEPT|nr:hypothetical protein [Leptospira ryugenii]GBF50353.1 hypothetical protein LPTSP4_18780 [Leptospira ryugenii]